MTTPCKLVLTKTDYIYGKVHKLSITCVLSWSHYRLKFVVYGKNALQNGLNHPDENVLCCAHILLLFAIRMRER
jgi:hypothetical protein